MLLEYFNEGRWGGPAVSEFAGVSAVAVTIVSSEDMIYTLPEPMKGLMPVIFIW